MGTSPKFRTKMKISNWVLTGIEIDLDHLRKYAKLIEDLLKNKEEEFNSWIEEKASKLSKDEKDEFYEFHSDDHWELSEVYPNILRGSLFVACISLAEHELISLCKYLHKENKYDLSLDDIKGKGIYRAKIYLNKVVNIENSISWNDILIFQKIRNFIVHNRGKLDKSDNAKEVENYVALNPSVKLDDLKRLQFSGMFCLEVIEKLGEFFNKLFQELKK